MEAVKLGSATVGLKNKTHAVLVALKRAASELSAYQKKLFPIDEHVGISISGLTADARMLRYDSIHCKLILPVSVIDLLVITIRGFLTVDTCAPNA